MSTIVVTGASAGLGLSISKYLLADSRKHRLILCCNSNDKPLKELANDPANADRVFIIKGDTADDSFVKTVYAQSLVHFQIDRIDSLVLNHGVIGDGSRVADGTQEAWEKVFRVNFFSIVGIVCERREV
jgi:NAD(P)-dependent dehydrogenase (short-subunit alcohol dehydrogenase family)